MKKTILLSIIIILLLFEQNSWAQCCPKFKLSNYEYCETYDSTHHHIIDNAINSVACKYSTKTYTVFPNLPGYTYTWVVNGGTPSATSGNPIEINWSGISGGSIKVIIQQTTGSCRDSLISNFCLLDGPQANFTASTHNICSNQASVNFTNTSIGGAYYSWDFGDGNTFVGYNAPSHTYTTAGTYIVALHVSNNPNLLSGQQNGSSIDCYCQDTKYDTIIVNNGTGPNITAVGCQGSICAIENKTITYTTSTLCSSYNWTVTGGTIIGSSTSNTVMVNWNTSYTVPPTITLTVATGCSGGCTASTTLDVPIIYPTFTITGKTSVCDYSKNTYSLPVWSGCYYNWSVTGSAYILSDDWNTNIITIEAAGAILPESYTVTCNYYDSIKMCGGTASMVVNILQDFSLSSTNLRICQGTTQTINANDIANWTLSKEGAIIATSSAPSTSFTFTASVAGIYTIDAVVDPSVSANYCNASTSTTIVVFEMPVISTIQSLSDNICDGDIIKYQVQSTIESYPYLWNLSGSPGSSIIQEDNNTVLVKWDGGPGSLSVYQDNPEISSCGSNTISFNTSYWSLPVITGPTTNICEDDIVTYTATPSTMSLGSYDWTVTGGAILSGQYSNTITVSWAGGGSHSVKVNTCTGVSNILTPTVNSYLTSTLSIVGTVSCTATLHCSIICSSYNWFLNGVLLTGTANTTQNIIATSSGVYSCKPVCTPSCTKTSFITVNLIPLPTPIISTPITGFCSPLSNIPALTFNSTLPVGTVCNYQWQFNGVNVSTGTGGTTATYTAPAAQAGTYTLVISRAGCTPSVVSNSITILSTNCTPPNCTLPNFPTTITINSIPCNNSYKAILGTAVPGTSISWNWGDGTSSSSAPGVNITHIYANPGIYQICANTVNSSYCAAQNCITKTIYFGTPNFSINYLCNGTATLTNTTPALSGISGYTVSWLPSIGTASIITANSSASVSTSANVTMTISYLGCSYTISKPVTIPTLGVVISPPTICNHTAFNYSATPSGFSVYNWSFSDGTTSSIASPNHSYTLGSSSVTATLTVTNSNGCTATNTLTSTVNPLPTAFLSATGDSSFCEGGFNQLTIASSAGNNFEVYYKPFNATTGFTLIGSFSLPTIHWNATQGGYYVIKAIDALGCADYSNIIPIIENPKPKFKININDNILCVSTSSSTGTSVSTANNSNYTYLWSVPTGSPITIYGPTNYQSFITIAAGTLTGNYTLFLTVTNAITSCSRTDSICIYVTSAPSVSISNIGSLCVGSGFTGIFNSIATPSSTYNYTWSNNAETPNISVTNSGAYYLQITDPLSGCSAFSNTLYVKPMPNLDLFPIGCDSICSDQHLYLPLVNGYSATAPNYLYPTQNWYVDGVLVGNMHFLPLNSYSLGWHSAYVTVSNNYGCTQTTNTYNFFVKNCTCTKDTTNLYASACNSYSTLAYSFASSGIYNIGTYTNYHGCDSTILLHLTINNSTVSNIYHTICANQSYFFNGINLNTTGIYKDTLLTYHGCDSTIILHLNVLPAMVSSIYDTICSNHPYIFNGVPINTTGIYNDTFLSSNGCDIIVILHLYVKYSPITLVSGVLCGTSSTYIFNGQSLTTAGTYFDTLTAANGCDSIIQLTLFNHNSYSNINMVVSCSTYTLNGVTYPVPGYYTQHLTNYLGCDSTIYIHVSNTLSSTCASNLDISTPSKWQYTGSSPSTGTYISNTAPSYFYNITGAQWMIPSPDNNNTHYYFKRDFYVCVADSYTLNINTAFDNYVALDLDATPIYNLAIYSTSTWGTNHHITHTQYLNAGLHTLYYDLYNVDLEAGFVLGGTITGTCISDSACAQVCVCTNDTLYETACDSLVTPSQIFTTNGSYIENLTNAGGCDSTVTHIITINHSTSSTTTITACDSVTWNGITFTQSTDCGGGIQAFDGSNVYYKYLTLYDYDCCTGGPNTITEGGMPYPVDGHFKVEYDCSGNGTVIEATGNYAIWNPVGSSYTYTFGSSTNPTFKSYGTCPGCCCNDAGDKVYFSLSQPVSSGYAVHFTNAAGCDSTAILHLTINYTTHITSNIAICAGQQFDFNGTTLTSAGTYYDTISHTGMCDSIYILNLTINPTSTTTIFDTICSGTPYYFNNILASFSGVYTASLVNYLGCDSLVILHLTIKPAPITITHQILCNNTPIIFNGFPINQAGSYFDTISVTNGQCDSIINLVVNDNRSYSSINIVLDCGSYTLNGVVYVTVGTYTQTLTNYLGCDSTITIHILPAGASVCNDTLSINTPNNWTLTSTLPVIMPLPNFSHSNWAPPYTNISGSTWLRDSSWTASTYTHYYFEREFYVCVADSYKFDICGAADNAMDVYLDIIDPTIPLLSISSLGSTSFNTSHCNTSYRYLTPGRHTLLVDLFNESGPTGFVLNGNITGTCLSDSACAQVCVCTNDTSLITACDSVQLPWQMAYTSGSYSHTYVNSHGCDSTIIMFVTINHSTSSVLNASICQNDVYNFDGQILNTSGTYNAIYTNAVGCDSLVTLTLNVINRDTTQIYDTICDGSAYIFANQSLTSNGDYLDIQTNIYGCDSMIYLHLYVIDINVHVSKIGDSLVASSIAGATYQWVDCENNYAIIPGATGSVYMPADDGNYAVITSYNGCTDTSSCNCCILSGIENLLETKLNIYPNPFQNVITVVSSKALQNASIRITNLLGQIEYSEEKLNGTSFKINTNNIPAGVYMIELFEGNNVIRKKIIKNLD